QGRAGGDHVGDGVGDTELHGTFHGTVQVDHPGVDTSFLQVGAQEPVEGRGDAFAVQVGQGHVLTVGGGETERGTAEPERQDLVDGGSGVHEHVPAGDPGLEDPLTDVHGDVLGPQEEELGLVVGVHHHQVSAALALPVPGFTEHFHGGFGELALV